MIANYTIPGQEIAANVSLWQVDVHRDANGEVIGKSIQIEVNGRTYEKDISDMNLNAAVLNNINTYIKASVQQILDIPAEDITGNFLS